MLETQGKRLMLVDKQGITIQTSLKDKLETDACTHTSNHNPNMFETQSGD